MKTKKRNTKKRQETTRKETIAVILFMLVMITVLGEFGKTMIVGDFLVFFFKYFFGILRYPLYFCILYVAYRMFRGQSFFTVNVKLIGFVLAAGALAVLLMIPGYNKANTLAEVFTLFHEHLGLQGANSFLDGGGIVGVLLYGILKQFTGLPGTLIIAILALLTGSALFLQKTLYEMLYPPIELTKSSVSTMRQSLANHKNKKMYDAEEYYDEDQYGTKPDYGVELADTFIDAEGSTLSETMTLNTMYYDMPDMPEPGGEVDLGITADFAKDWQQDAPTESTEPSAVALNHKPYRIPGLHFLNAPKASNSALGQIDLSRQTQALQEALNNFKIKATVTSVQVGPAVTQYEVTLAPGVKVNRIVNLATDIALALAVKDVRIEAPIPGKSAVGIEVPNESVRMVGLYEVLRKGYQNKNKKLLVGLGRTINGDEVQIEINKMPHLLVAGATGSGKSVCVNAIILSILLRAKPDEVKFLMIDPKKVELNVYNDIPHLLAPVVTNPKKAAVALRKVVKIMEDRYEKFADAFVRNLESYNEYARQNALEELPYIVVIIDELSDLMVVASKEVEESIMRLAQMARAAGIHLIVATQRPSVDVITGVIKSNIPSRIAFAVSSQVDSRTILDIGGAEKLVGQGDMLYLPAGENKPIRVQGAYVSETEIEKVVHFVKAQQASKYDTGLLAVAVQPVEEDNNELFPRSEKGELDELFREAVAFARSVERISGSMLRRRFNISSDRAARIMDSMVERGMLGPAEGNKGRRVLIRESADVPSEKDIPMGTA